MKRFIKSLVVVAFVFGTYVPTMGQTSTQGKEFWVSLVPGQYAEADKADKQKASSSGNGFKPYIAISAQKACEVTISNPRTGWSHKVSVNANEWKEIGKNGEIPIAQWYTPDAMPTSEKAYDLGLKVESTEDVSVYCSLRWGFSADATNILPINALQSEYIVQTYEAIKQNITFDDKPDQPKTEDNDFNGVQKNSFSILAAEDCVVDVELAASTSGGKSGKIEGISLSQGQVYHVLSAVNQSLSGSRVVARNGKKIAVFAGAPSTRLPNAFSDRDLLYEQLFPIDYWGQHFIIVRSKQKDANRIIITAQADETKVTIHGQYDPSTSKFEDHTIKKDYTFTLNAGEQYEFEMSAGYADDRWHKKRSAFKGITVIDTAAFISTSCPCAVVSYDVGNKYLRDDATEVYNDGSNNYGAPAMTWIAPIEQMLNDVVFGVMGSDKVTRHFVNIVIEKRDLPFIKLNGNSLESSFREVDSNNDYCYARLTLDETDPNGDTPNPFYHLESKYGFIATVYGNGHNESYAYAAGSSAVKEGVLVGGVIYNDGEKDPNKYICVNSKDIEFNARVGLDQVTRADWNFGDGTTLRNAQTSVTHTYTSPGWYDVTVQRFGHQVCTDADEQDLGAISFSIRVIKPYIKYVPTAVCHEKGETLPADGPDGSVDLDQCLDTIIVPYNVHGYNTDSIIDLGAVADSIVVDGVTYRRSGEAMQVLKNSDDCELRITTKWEIIASLDFKITNTDVTACDSTDVELPFDYVKGDLGEAWIVDLGTGKKTDVDRSYLSDLEPGTGTFNLPTNDLRPGIYNLELHIKDPQAEQYGWKIKEYTYQIRLTVQYSEHIFKRKYNNVLAVYKAGRGANAGYSFNGYQWYFRDAEDNIAPIFGATSSVYHTEEPLKTGWYSVDLTDQAAVTIRTCEQYIDESKLPDFTPAENEPEGAPQKVLRDQRVLILMENKLYNMYGQQVK